MNAESVFLPWPKKVVARINKALKKTVSPYAEEVLRIAADGDVAVVFYECADETFIRAALRSTAPVVRLTSTDARRVWGRLENEDPAFLRWITTRNVGAVRVLLCIHSGTLCLNITDGPTWSVEPGTLDSERMN